MGLLSGGRVSHKIVECTAKVMDALQYQKSKMVRRLAVDILVYNGDTVHISNCKYVSKPVVL